MILNRHQLEILINKLGQPKATEVFNKIFHSYCKFLSSQDVKELYDDNFLTRLHTLELYMKINEEVRLSYINKSTYEYLLSKNLNDSKILDIGCGAGDLLFAIAKTNKAFNAVGIDFSSDAIEAAKRKKNNLNVLNCNFYNCDVSDLESKETFNYIILNDVTEHISDLELTDLFKGIKKVMSADSIIIIHTPNGFALCNDTSFSFLQSIRKRIKILLGGGVKGIEKDVEGMYYAQVHINIKTYKELKLFLKNLGFVSKVKYDDPFPLNFLSYLFSSNMLVIAKRKH